MKSDNATLATQSLPQLAIGGGALAHSLWSRGPRRAALFAGVGLGLPALAEYTGVNRFHLVKHHTSPQVAGVPLAALTGWYTITYATYAVLEGILPRLGLRGKALRFALPAATALVATDLDVLLDVFGLANGFWEWRDGGPYAAEIVGPNGKRGIPYANYTGWLALVGTVTTAYQLLARRIAPTPPSPPSPPSASPRWAALLLGLYYVPAVGWALSQRSPRYLAYSGLVPLALAAALWPKRAK